MIPIRLSGGFLVDDLFFKSASSPFLDSTSFYKSKCVELGNVKTFYNQGPRKGSGKKQFSRIRPTQNWVANMLMKWRKKTLFVYTGIHIMWHATVVGKPGELYFLQEKFGPPVSCILFCMIESKRQN